MAFLYSEAQIAIGEQANRQLADRFDGNSLRALLGQPGGYDHELWRLCVENGWPSLAIPEAYGGLGLGLVELCLIGKALGRNIAGMPFLATSFACGDAITRHGDDAQKARILPDLAAGSRIGVLATTEGVEIAPRRPHSQVANGLLSGVKAAVTGGAAADIAIVYACDGDASDEPSLFIAEMAGVQRAVIDSFDNSRCAADLIFENTPVTRLAGAGHAGLEALLARLAVVLAAQQAGGADACIEQARDYANSRHAFGQPIGKFQSVKHGITEMWILAELARASTMDAAHRLDCGAPGAALTASCAWLNASEAYEKSAWLAVQVHGGIGVTWDADLHLHYRRARAMALELGRPAYWEDRIVEELEQT